MQFFLVLIDIDIRNGNITFHKNINFNQQILFSFPRHIYGKYETNDTVAKNTFYNFKLNLPDDIFYIPYTVRLQEFFGLLAMSVLQLMVEILDFSSIQNARYLQLRIH